MKDKTKNTDGRVDCIRLNGVLVPRLHGGRQTLRFKSPKDYNRKNGKMVDND